MSRALEVSALVLSVACIAYAGGPKYVAGSSYFNPSTMGQPIVWPGGQLNYYTDQGDLSPILPNSAANAFVASAFQQWTSVATAEIAANAAGHLAEDVNGSNIEVNSAGAVTAPADITPSAVQTPIAIVYDFDGSITDALLGEGAGNPSECFSNAVYGSDDNFGAEGNFLHALVVINGQCALQSSQLTDVEYRLVRVLGSVLGMGWSQLNLNVITGDPPPTPQDYAGFPLMHYMDPVNCVPITVCFPNPYQLAPDDQAALSRLYPLPASPSTARIYGSVYFTNATGQESQPMQGVNVVARWIDPSTGQPSDQYSVSSVSGFLFTGNAGNPITGLSDPLGIPYSEFGSDSQAVEGFFDLGGLPVPDGAATAQYQVTVETIDSTWSAGVCPYDFSQVTPSGDFTSIIVTVNAGGEFKQDILMPASAQPAPLWETSKTWNAPAPIASAGDWIGTLNGYDDVDYFQIAAQANRTLSVAVTALDEAGVSSESKTEPVIGMWTLGDAQGTPPPVFTSAPFNASTFGMSRLDTQVLNPGTFIIGISDLRGDGRPDYSYHAHVLYSDSVSPSRVPVSGGPVILQGMGFTTTLGLAVGSTDVPLLASNAGQILLQTPEQSDGPQTITVTDPSSGAFSIMTDALTFGAAATDEFYKSAFLQGGGNSPTPVGIPAAIPVTALVVASDGMTPVNGATVVWSTTNGAVLSICGGTPGCSTVTNESGIVSTSITATLPGVATVTAALAPATYSNAQTVSGTLLATATGLGLGVTTPYLWIAQGANLSVPITAQLMTSAGNPQAGTTVNFRIAQGSGSLSSSNAITNSAGFASVTLTLTNFSANVQVVACVEPAGSPCQTVYGNAVSPSLFNLQPVAGAGQVVSGTVFQPLSVRVTDSSTPPDPVLGASVVFQSLVLRPAGNNPILINGDPGSGQNQMPVLLSTSQTTAQSAVNGLASLVPSVGAFTGTLEIQIQVSAGSSGSLQDVMESLPQDDGNASLPPVKAPWRVGVPIVTEPER